jgi:tRNA 2-selenouridine synthase
MKDSIVYFFDIPFEERLDYLIPIYGEFPKDKLANAIERIKKRLGGLETKNALIHLENNDFKSCFRILLTYYDRWYFKGLKGKKSVVEIETENTDIKLNKIKLIKLIAEN